MIWRLHKRPNIIILYSSDELRLTIPYSLYFPFLFQIFKPSECYSRLKRISKQDVVCQDAPLPDDLSSLFACLTSPILTNLFGHMNKVNDLSPRIKEWDSFIGEFEEKKEEHGMSTEREDDY